MNEIGPIILYTTKIIIDLSVVVVHSNITVLLLLEQKKNNRYYGRSIVIRLIRL